MSTQQKAVPAKNVTPNDVRRLFPRFADANIDPNLKIVRQLTELAARRGVTAAQFALAWVRHKGPDIVSIPGTRSIPRLRENVAAAAIELSDDEAGMLEEIAPIGAAAGERYGVPMMQHIDR